MNSFSRFINNVFNSFILGFSFGLGIIFSFFITGLLVFNAMYPKIMDFLTHIN